MQFNAEQNRCAENMAMAYDAWIANERAWHQHRDRLSWKTVKGRDYLYRVVDRRGNGKSLGPRSAELEEFERGYSSRRDAAQAARKSLSGRLTEVGRIARAVRLPGVDETVGRILAESDRRDMLGQTLIAVGTNAMLAYAYAAGVIMAPELQSTADFDLAWSARREAFALAERGTRPIFNMLKAVDSTFTVNTERSFQARNADAFEVELLAAPSVVDAIPKAEPLRPVGNLPEQEWLLRGTPVREIVRAGATAVCAIVAPDPRWFALHKLWLSRKPSRNRRKVQKDHKQGQLLWEMARAGQFALHPVGDEFIDGLPEELRQVLAG